MNDEIVLARQFDEGVKYIKSKIIEPSRMGFGKKVYAAIALMDNEIDDLVSESAKCLEGRLEKNVDATYINEYVDELINNVNASLGEVETYLRVENCENFSNLGNSILPNDTDLNESPFVIHKRNLVGKKLTF